MLGQRRVLIGLALLTVAAGIAMLPAMGTMSDHGASVIDFEFAGSVERSKEIVAEWGDAGKAAAWWQLALDVPFLIGYGLLLFGACTALARRAAQIGHARLCAAAAAVAWFGPAAACADMFQNVSLALILAGHETQPWPALSFLGGAIAFGLMASGIAFVAIGWIRTRAEASPVHR
jgi:hypothetical protein